MQLPLFPLRSVLCPGVALPLHIFEERYRLMVGRCIERSEPFGVVLVREGSDVGPIRGRMAEVGTVAAIRRAGRFPDGRLEILTVGQQRFRLDAVDSTSEPYMLGTVSLLDEPLGTEAAARAGAERVGRRFLEYLHLLQPEGVDDGPEIEIEFEIEVDEDAEEANAADLGAADALSGSGDAGEDQPAEAIEPRAADLDTVDLSPEQRRELLMAAARRLTATDDPTALSYVLTALIQVDLSARQDLLEAPDTVERLDHLDRLLARESWFLRMGLRPIIIDAGQITRRGA
jgi:Lon protease-like protein